MADHSQRPELPAAVAAALTELEAVTSYQHSQREPGGGQEEARHRAGPLEFDDAGFPVAQSVDGFLRRVGRWLRDG